MFSVRIVFSPFDALIIAGQAKSHCVAWTVENLLAEIKDDKLIDLNKDPLKAWWDDDCLEIFIDADNSGGGHQFTHNAFAYHVALDGNVVEEMTDWY